MLKHMRNLLGGALLAIALGIPYLQAADVAISALPAGTTLTGTEAIPAVQSATTVKTTPAAIKTYVETGGTVTASDPVLDMSQTWNNAAVPFTGLKFNVTDTASASNSNLFDIQSSGTSRMRFVEKTGVSSDYRLALFGDTLIFVRYGANYISGSVDTGYRQWLFQPGTGFAVSSADYIGFSSQQFNAAGSAFDIKLYRDAAANLALRDGTTAQTLRVYGTYTDASNYERLAILPGAASGWMQIAAQTAGTGTDNISFALTPAGTGAISAQVPDSGTAGGNARGTNAVDWQRARISAAQAATGNQSVIGGGSRNTASGTDSVVGGGNTNSSSAVGATVSGGAQNTASGVYSWVPGGYQATTRGLVGAYAYSAGQRNALGDAQVIGQPVRRTTTDATPVSLATDGTPAATTIMIVPDGAVMMCTALVVAKPSASITDGVGFDIEGLVYRSGSTTALLSIPNSTAHGGNTLALAATFVANDTLEGLEIQVTGAAATTIYWAGELKCVQVL